MRMKKNQKKFLRIVLIMIRLEKLSREFQGGKQVVHALDEVDLEIKENE
ncbi:MAG: hypothetical protein Ct9H90mP13_00730 [Pseudomonadota bacterium]|nr:MAG: hypothetical protein Ct9H90mP13_00730 [Pseudomonadota bacterium]